VRLISDMRRLHLRVKEEPQPFRFLLSRFLWHTGAGRRFLIALDDDLRVRFHPSALSATLWLDPDFNRLDRDLLKSYLHAGGVFVDVGANVGVLTLAAAQRVGPSGRVYAIEPHPAVYQYLIDNIALNGFSNVVAMDCALGATEGLANLSDRRSDDQNSIVDASALSVPMRRLDDIVPPDERVDLLKIDVEGFELFVLRGASDTLKRTASVYVEVWDERSRRFGYRARDVIAILRDAGFLLVRPTEATRPLDDDIGRTCENVLATRDANAAWSGSAGSRSTGAQR
jgi:FkbM family methyltransferase